MTNDERIKFPRVDAVIMSIEVSPPVMDLAQSSENSYLYQLRGAQNVGVFEPFTEEQSALNDYLTKQQAGKKLCDYAWRLFAQSF